MCVCGGRVSPLPGQFVILRGNTVNDARTRDLPIWAFFSKLGRGIGGVWDRAKLLLKEKFD